MNSGNIAGILQDHLGSSAKVIDICCDSDYYRRRDRIAALRDHVAQSLEGDALTLELAQEALRDLADSDIEVWIDREQEMYAYQHGMIVSEATLRSSDLIDAFSNALSQLDRPRYHEILREYADFMDAYLGYEGSDQERLFDDREDLQTTAGYLIESLFDALNDAAPEYMYFGAHEGDGALFGFWLAVEDY